MNHAEINISGKLGIGLSIKLDAEDYGKVSKHSWKIRYNRSGSFIIYTVVKTNSVPKTKTLSVNDMIFGEATVAKHKNGDCFDFRKCNLDIIKIITEPIFEQDIVKIPLHGKAGVGTYLIVDREDFNFVSKYKWSLSHGYPTSFCKERDETIRLHRELKGNPNNMTVDHKDGNRLNNRKSNLRVVSKANNNKNQGFRQKKRGNYKGVTWEGKRKKWRASIVNNKKEYFLGYYDNEEDGAKAYNVMAEKLHGEFARLNPIDHIGFVITKRTYSSTYRGVGWHKQHNKWVARLQLNKKMTYIGYYEKELDAAKAVNAYILENNIDYPLNDIPEGA